MGIIQSAVMTTSLVMCGVGAILATKLSLWRSPCIRDSKQINIMHEII